MDDIYAGEYEELFERHWWWRAKEAYLLAKLRKIVPQGGFGPILDVGCGNGLFFDELRAFGDPEGVEINGSIVDDRGYSRGHIYVEPFGSDFRPGKRYGLILMADVLEHFAEPSDSLRHAASLLADGGLLAITVPAFNCLWTFHDDVNHHLTRFTRRGLREVLGKSNLVTARLEYFHHWLFPLKLLVRLAEVGRSAPVNGRFATVPRWPINGVMLGLCRVEHALFRNLPVPFGSSLFALVQRSGDRDPWASAGA